MFTPLGSFWEIIILRVFILEALELWAFGDLWILRDGRNRRKSQVTTGNGIWVSYESVIKGNMTFHSDYWRLHIV